MACCVPLCRADYIIGFDFGVGGTATPQRRRHRQTRMCVVGQPRAYLRGSFNVYMPEMRPTLAEFYIDIRTNDGNKYIPLNWAATYLKKTKKLIEFTPGTP